MPLTDFDRQLLQQLVAQQPGAWRLFVDRYAPLVIRVVQHTSHAHSVKLGADDAEDLCADVFAELLARNMAALRGFRGRCSLTTYLTIIVRRMVVRRLTERRYSEAMGHVSAHQVAVDRADAKGSKLLNQIENRDEIESILGDLPGQTADVVRAFYLDGLTYSQISSKFSIPANSIGPMLTRARETLGRNRLKFG